uniref:Cellular tumor antigen p53 n=1 Tax=Culex pipiens TaxID=7175 RepID=A0A8D8GY08_CULPI
MGDKSLQGFQELSHNQKYFLTPLSLVYVVNETRVESNDDFTDIKLVKLEEQPALEEFTNPMHDFKVKLEESGSTEFFAFSKKLNRVFTSTDKAITFSMVMNPHTPLLIRIMLVCSNVIFQPLSRCSYHSRGDSTTFRDHVVTHKDSVAKYFGTADGVYFRERLAILVPIEETGQKSISLEFKCLSSCYKIKKVATALIFTLEDEISGNILGRQVLNVHVSKNFKRDMELAEKAASVKRRLSGEFESEAAGPSASKRTIVDLSELKFLLPQEVVREFLEGTQQFIKAKLYNAEDDGLKGSLTTCLEKVNVMIDNFASNSVESGEHDYCKRKV